MERVWKPLDVGYKRLYKVRVKFYADGKYLHQDPEPSLVLANSPRAAARLVHRIYDQSDLPEGVRVDCFGEAVKVLMPKSWWDDGVPGQRSEGER